MYNQILYDNNIYIYLCSPNYCHDIQCHMDPVKPLVWHDHEMYTYSSEQLLTMEIFHSIDI